MKVVIERADDGCHLQIFTTRSLDRETILRSIVSTSTCLLFIGCPKHVPMTATYLIRLCVKLSMIVMELFEKVQGKTQNDEVGESSLGCQGQSMVSNRLCLHP
jgi:hypothetical protein